MCSYVPERSSIILSVAFLPSRVTTIVYSPTLFSLTPFTVSRYEFPAEVGVYDDSVESSMSLPLWYHCTIAWSRGEANTVASSVVELPESTYWTSDWMMTPGLAVEVDHNNYKQSCLSLSLPPHLQLYS